MGVALAMTLAGLAACGGGPESEVPTPGTSTGVVPNLESQAVMVLPIQIEQGVPSSADGDRELGFALAERGPSVNWLFPDTLRTITGRNPGIDVRLEGLPVGIFLRMQVERIGDPLFGQIRRLNALTSAPLVLIPVRLRYRSTPVAVGDRVFEPAMELTAALLHARTGRVLWFGVVDGATGGPEDPRTLATAADRLARALAP